MTLYSVLFPDVAELVARKWFKAPGSFNWPVPAGATYLRAHARGCGGQGENWGGGGALVRSVVPVVEAENLLIQVGTASTQSVLGDSFVKRNSGVIIAYADRGRGNSNGGSAAFSTGGVKRDGAAGNNTTGIGGAPASDVLDAEPVIGPGRGSQNGDGRFTYGGGGKISYIWTEADIAITMAHPAGPGLVCLEFFDGNPGL
jgi:hypothetical protein